MSIARSLLAVVVTGVSLGAIVPSTPQESVQCISARASLQQWLAEWPVEPQPPDIETGITRLTGVVNTCSVPDAHYYLALLFRAKGDELRANHHLQQARNLGAEAYRDRRSLVGTKKEPGASPDPKVLGLSPYVRRRLALIVGIGRFQDPNISALKYTARDARAIAETLRTVAEFSDVRELIDEQATTVNIKTAMDELARQADAEDLVVVYLSSHGSPQDADTAGISYVVTHDTALGKLYGTAYKMTDLLEDLAERIQAQRVVAFLDTCFSAGTFKKVPDGWSGTGTRALTFEGGPASAMIQTVLQQASSRTLRSDAPVSGKRSQGIGRVVISSSGMSEKSWEDDRIQHGYFTYFLLEALRRPGAPPSIDDIFVYLKDRVPAAVRRDKGQTQTPTMVASSSRVELYIRENEIAAPPTRAK